jgi:hypothetical protein
MMPRRKARGRTKAKAKSKKSNGTNGTRKKGNGAWTPQRRGSPEAWMKKLGYTPAALRCRTLADMTEEEIVAIEIEYGAPVIRPGRGNRRRSARRLVESTANETTTQDWW